MGKANNETEFQNRAGGEPAPLGEKSGFGKIKKWLKLAANAMGGRSGRPRKNRKNFGKFDFGITLQQNPNLFSKKLLSGFKVSAKGGQMTTNSGGQKGRGLGGRNFCPLFYPTESARGGESGLFRHAGFFRIRPTRMRRQKRNCACPPSRPRVKFTPYKKVVKLADLCYDISRN